MLRFMARVEEEAGHGFVASFPDLPEAMAAGESRDMALNAARSVLEAALLYRARDNEPLPAAAATGPELVPVDVSAMVLAKIGFILAFHQSGMTRVELGRRIGKSEGEVRRLLDPWHGSKLAALDTALRAMGKAYAITVEDSAA